MLDIGKNIVQGIWNGISNAIGWITSKVKEFAQNILKGIIEVAYMTDNKLYITDGEFLNSLQLGNFAFYPRSSGNLSFKKIK